MKDTDASMTDSISAAAPVSSATDHGLSETTEPSGNYNSMRRYARPS